ncbi:hypothetical protein JYJ95_12845 [Corallococcus exiguus]|uniref:hypothetical protein n=1 Tax=Corallococcus exiguus TaxID=83462 RepID=UPI001A907595|nr:hypothetical protein [Corallococcus exiguus]MBN8467403.1 hypothetical protein [Corallococcus exiguus]
MTREHIWPKVLIERAEDDLWAYQPEKAIFYKGEPTIKDVCSECNNKKLSQLDAYLAGLYDSHLHRVVMPGEAAQFAYDYAKLVRTLFKISYNSGRAWAEPRIVNAHKKLSKFILDGGYCTKHMLRLQIVTAAKRVNAEDRSLIGYLEPRLMRCALVPYDGQYNNRFLVRLVAINSYWFYLILPYKKEPVHIWEKFVSGFSNWITPTGIYVNPGQASMQISVEQTTYLHPDLLGALGTAMAAEKGTR